jgi:hypothetical protein
MIVLPLLPDQPPHGRVVLGVAFGVAVLCTNALGMRSLMSASEEPVTTIVIFLIGSAMTLTPFVISTHSFCAREMTWSSGSRSSRPLEIMAAPPCGTQLLSTSSDPTPRTHDTLQTLPQPFQPPQRLPDL